MQTSSRRAKGFFALAKDHPSFRRAVQRRKPTPDAICTQGRGPGGRGLPMQNRLLVAGGELARVLDLPQMEKRRQVRARQGRRAARRRSLRHGSAVGTHAPGSERSHPRAQDGGCARIQRAQDRSQRAPQQQRHTRGFVSISSGRAGFRAIFSKARTSAQRSAHSALPATTHAATRRTWALFYRAKFECMDVGASHSGARGFR